jgi:hypothetical protein
MTSRFEARYAPPLAPQATLSLTPIVRPPSEHETTAQSTPGDLYQSLKLQAGVRKIRVLFLHPASTTEHGKRLKGNLRVHSMSPGTSEESFAALSYVWGTEESRATITCNGCDIPIKQNCHDALMRLSPADGHQPIPVWVDSICINQDDVQERSHQVEMMLDIYSKAETVFIWVHSEGAIHAKTHAAFQTIHAAILAAKTADEQENYRETQDALTFLLASSWFYRGWTFQELILGSNPKFLTSHDVLLWHDLNRLVLSYASDIRMRPSLARFLSLTTLWATVNTRRRWKIIAMKQWTIFMTFGLCFLSPKSFCQKILFVSPHDERMSILKSIVNILRDLILLALLYGNLNRKREAPPWLISGFWRTIYPIGDWLILIITMGVSSGMDLGPGLQFPFAWPGRCPRMLFYGVLGLWILQSLGKEYFVRQLRALVDAAYVATVVPRLAHEHYRWDNLPGLLHLCRWNRQLECAGVMEALRTRSVGNPKDKAYAMYGILGELGVRTKAPDYSVHVSCQEVYSDLFIQLVSWRPTMLALLVHAGKDSKIHEVRSWVPDWRTDIASAWLPEDVLRQCTSKSVYTCVRACGMPFYSFSGNILSVLGRQLDTVALVFELPHTSLPQTDPAALDAISQWLKLVRGTTDSPRKSTSEADILDILAVGTENMAGDASSSPLRARLDLWYHNFVAHHPRLRAPQSELTNHDDLSHPGDWNGFEETRVELQHRICGKRLLFITKNGRYGTGSLNLREGDKVHLISGVPTPLCLRKEVYGQPYEIVGPVFMNRDGSDDIWRGGLSRIKLA